MDDYEILYKVWSGGIPIEFRLDKEEILAKSDVSYYEILPRISYFYLELENALKYFSNAVDNLGDFSDLWLESQGTMLKWNYPIGVLFDLHSNTDSLPWVITIHLKKFPDTLIRFTSRDEKRNCFLQSLKEADQLKHRGHVVSEMKPDEHNKLFDSICNRKFDDFRSANNKLRAVENAFHLPIRVYLAKDKTFQQILIRPRKEDSTEITLNDAINLTYPNQNFDNFEFITHGISLPKDVCLRWLIKHLSYADNFLHIVIK